MNENKTCAGDVAADRVDVAAEDRTGQHDVKEDDEEHGDRDNVGDILNYI